MVFMAPLMVRWAETVGFEAKPAWGVHGGYLSEIVGVLEVGLKMKIENAVFTDLYSWWLVSASVPFGAEC